VVKQPKRPARKCGRDRKCDGCGKPFRPWNLSQRYCSRRCWGSSHSGHNHQQHTRLTLRCEWCRREFTRTPYEAKKVRHHYCSHDCSSKAHSLKMRGLSHGEPNATRHYGRSAWRRLRLAIIERDKGCVKCGLTEEQHRERYGVSISVDHKVARKDGGADDADNLQCLCRSCHAIKTNKGH
jgi:hypothetical protein